MSNNKHTGGIFGKGYYIAIVLCAAAIGIAGFMYYRNTNETDATLQEPDSDAVISAEQDQDVAAVATQPQGTASNDGTENTTAPTEKKALKTGAPVSGETVAGYAMETLSYNETTRDWRVHNGIDIAAEAGATVCAAADGTVYTTYVDDTMGATVVIRHQDGYVTTYSSLDSNLLVQPGTTVKLGQAIGTVGNTAMLESALGDHLHFSVSHNDQPMDPAEFLALG